MNKLIEQIIEEIKLIEQEQKRNPNLFVPPKNWVKIQPFSYKNKSVTLYYNYNDGEFYLNTIGSKETRIVSKDEYYDINNLIKKSLSKIKDNLELTKNLNNKYKKLNNNNTPNKVSDIKTNNIPNKVSDVKPKQVNNVKTDPKEQRWVGIWEKFLVKYVGYNGGDKDNLTNDIDKAVYKFISQNKKLYQKNTNINLGNLEKLMTDGKKGPVHDSFLPPFYYNTDTFPIYFYQKSNKIKEIQAKLGVKQTGIFLNQTESAIVKNSKKYNITYSRKNGITKEIYDAIMKVNNIPSDINSLNTDINNYWGFEKREVKE